MEMALLLKKPKNAWVENAKIAWERIFENECDDLKGCCAVRILYSMVKKHCKNGEESYVIQISDLIQIAESRKKNNQPFILCAGSLQNPGSVSTAIECNSLVLLDGDDPLRWLMILFSMYYILDWAYPAAADDVYKHFEKKLFNSC